MPVKPQDLYGTGGGANYALPEGGFTPGMSTRASPADFGAQVGEAVQGAGSAAQKVGAEAVDFAQQRQGMLNETLMTNADTQYSETVGKLTGDYKSLEGMDAVNGRQAYVDAVTAARTQYRSQLPPQAQRGFDLLALHREGLLVGDANGYAATQLKQASYTSSNLSVKNSIQQAGSAQSIDELNAHLGNITYQTGAQFDGHEGIETDPQTGQTRFAKTPAGVAAQTDFSNLLQQNKGAAWQKYIGNMSKTTPLSAYNVYLEHKDTIPAPAQTTIEAMLAPRIADAQGKIVRDSVFNQAHSDWFDIVSSPQNLAAYRAQENTPNEGGALGAPALDKYPAQTQAESGGDPNAVSSAGALGTKQIMPSTGSDPGFGVKPWDGTAKDNIRFGNDYYDAMFKKYGNVQDALAAYNWGTGKVDAWKASGGDFSKLPAETQAYVTKLAPKMQDMAALQQGTQVTSNAPSSPINAPQPLSKADWYRKNYAQILQNVDAASERQHPGDARFMAGNRTAAEQQMNDEIRQQEMSYKVDTDTVYKAIDGSMSGGKAPTSVADLKSISQDVAQAWNNVQSNSPMVASSIENKLLTLNSRGVNKTASEYGTGFLNLFSDIHSGKITDESQLVPHISEDGSNNTITYAGWKQLQNEFKTPPEDKTEGLYQKELLEGLHNQMVFSKFDADGEKKYQSAQVAVFNEIKRLKAAGVSPSEIYDPSSKNWAGKVAAPLMPTPVQASMNNLNQKTPDQIQSDMDNPAVRTPERMRQEYINADDPVKRAALVKEMVAKGIIREDTSTKAPVSK